MTKKKWGSGITTASETLKVEFLRKSFHLCSLIFYYLYNCSELDPGSELSKRRGGNKNFEWFSWLRCFQLVQLLNLGHHVDTSAMWCGRSLWVRKTIPFGLNQHETHPLQKSKDIKPAQMFPFTYFWHFMHQQEGNADGGDVVCAADLEDVPEPHDGRVPGGHVHRPDVVIHAQVKGNVDFWEVWVPCDVELSCTIRQIRKVRNQVVICTEIPRKKDKRQIQIYSRDEDIHKRSKISWTITVLQPSHTPSPALMGSTGIMATWCNKP